MRILDPDRNEIGSIANANEPCGLAVQSDGDLYVSEQATGNVVRYGPAAFPFVGPPAYGGPEPIDSSAEVKGIAVDPFDDRLYAARPGAIAVYQASGLVEPAVNEVQRLRVSSDTTGGTYTLGFRGEEAVPLAYDAPCDDIEAGTPAVIDSVEEALEDLSTIGSGSVTVEKQASTDVRRCLITFAGTLFEQAVPTITGKAQLTTTGFGLDLRPITQGFSGFAAEDALADYSGVAAYTYSIAPSRVQRYLFTADGASDQVEISRGESLPTLEPRRTISGVDHDRNPQTSDQSFGFGTAGTALTADPGYCPEEIDDPAPKQACTAGHFLLYDAANEALDEFDARGEFVNQIVDPGFEDAGPSAIAVDRSSSEGNGTLYVGAGAGDEAFLGAFKPLVRPSRVLLPGLSRVLIGARSVAIDYEGNVYVATQTKIHVFDPNGAELTNFAAPSPYGLALDSAGNLYALVVEEGQGSLVRYVPSGATFTRHEPPIWAGQNGLDRIAVDPTDDHVYVGTGIPLGTKIYEFGSAGEANPSLGAFASFFSFSNGANGLGVYQSNGELYATGGAERITLIDDAGTEAVAEITGATSPAGIGGTHPTIAVDQSNGHVIAYQPSAGAQEYDAAGSFVTDFGTTSINPGGYDIAADNSCALHDPPLTEATTPSCAETFPANGNLYIAYDDDNPASEYDLTAFSPLSYGEAPIAVTGTASGIDGGDATLNGTVNPRGFALEGCAFEYMTDAAYQSNLQSEDPPFEGASSEPCAETPTEIGEGSSPVSVHADVVGLDTDQRYRCRLVANNEYGQNLGNACLFGPPLLTQRPAQPITYSEATLRAEIDPSGLATTYRFEYGPTTSYGSVTAPVELPPGDGPIAVKAPLFGLAEGATYHFRVLVENDAGTIDGADQQLITPARPPVESCPNAEYRTGPSSNLPDCRAYELVTPADNQGRSPTAIPGSGPQKIFNNWLVTPRGPGNGERVSFFAATLPGFEGSGDVDGYRAQRGPGLHPSAGWTTEMVSPTYAQYGVESAPGVHQEGIAAGQLHSLWSTGFVATPGTLPQGNYLRTPAGFELIGQGSLGTDPHAESRFLSPDAEHVVFFSTAHLEPGAAPAGTMAVYDRAAGSASAEVISVKPDDTAFGAGEAAAFVGATEDGASVLFRVGSTIYLHREGATTAVVDDPAATYAGVSADGERVFFANGSGLAPAGLFVCDVQAGSCAGPGAQEPTSIAPEAIFVNVANDGSRVLLTSEQVLTGSEANDAGETAAAGEPNLYTWDEGGTRFVAVLDPQDLVSFGGEGEERLSQWTRAINPGPNTGRAFSPTRSTPDGEVFVFQSHAQLSPYENEGHGQIYRYTPGGAMGERLICVSCDPSGAAPSGDALLQVMIGNAGGHTHETTLLANVTDGGGAVLFHSPDRLLPEDVNDVNDVYRWEAAGQPGCELPGGCLALISTGQGEEQSTLYGMSADGRDVLFVTPEELVGRDIPGSVSIYDARVDGGIPETDGSEPCQGDACRPPRDPSPDLGVAGETTRAPIARGSRCPKGKRRVVRKGKARCVKRGGKQRNKQRANRNRRPGR